MEERLKLRETRAAPRERAWVGRLLVHTEHPERAITWLGAHDDPQVATVRGLALGRVGSLTESVRQLEAAVAAGAGPSTASELRRARANLCAVSEDWRPAAPPGSRYPAVPGRVLHLLNNSLPQVQAGYTVRAQRVAFAQRAEGFEPVMATRPGFPWDTGSFDASPRDLVDGIPYHHVRADDLIGTGIAVRAERGAAALAPLVASLRPALLHPTSPFVNAQMALALRETFGMPVVYEMRGFLEDTWLSRRGPGAEESEFYRLTRATEGRCAAAADHIVTLGVAMRDDLVTRGVDRASITVVPNGVDIERFRVSGIGQALRSGLGLDRSVVLGYISSLVGYEGVETLLAAVRELRDRGHGDVRGLIVGDGAARSGLEATCARLGLEGAVTFTGRVPHDEVLAYYEAIDIFVVPRRDERVCRLVTPLKPVEAMAMQRCVVVSALPALEELITPGVSGFTFTADDAGSLADVVEPLIADPRQRAEAGAAAREQVREERTWQANGRRYRAIYEQLGVPPGPPDAASPGD